MHSSQMTLEVSTRHLDAYLYGNDAWHSIISAKYSVGDAYFWYCLRDVSMPCSCILLGVQTASLPTKVQRSMDHIYRTADIVTNSSDGV